MNEPLPNKSKASAPRKDPGPARPARSLERQLKVRFYCSMRPQRVYPLTVQVQGPRGNQPVASAPVVLRPVIAGAQVTPSEQRIDVSVPGASAKFHVTPLAWGRLTDARVEIHHQGQTPEQVRLRMKAKTQRRTWILLEKAPRDRYASAAELADDLNRLLQGESIRARSFDVLGRLARTLERSHHDVEFRSWGTMLLLFGVVILVAHFVCFVMLLAGLPVWLDWLVRIGQFVVLGLIFWRYRPGSLLPTTAAERQLWSIWLGYLLGFGTARVVLWLLSVRQVIVAGPAAPPRWEELALYPISSLLAGLGFFIMGGTYWGRFYALGAAFFALAVVMPLWLDGAPLLFGVTWGVVLTAVGLHLRRLGVELEPRGSTNETSSSPARSDRS